MTEIDDQIRFGVGLGFGVLKIQIGRAEWHELAEDFMVSVRGSEIRHVRWPGIPITVVDQISLVNVVYDVSVCAASALPGGSD